MSRNIVEYIISYQIVTCITCRLPYCTINNLQYRKLFLELNRFPSISE